MRIEYSVGLWRLLTILETCLAQKEKSRHVQLLESFGANAASTFNDLTPRTLIHLAQLQFSEVKVNKSSF